MTPPSSDPEAIPPRSAVAVLAERHGESSLMAGPGGDLYPAWLVPTAVSEPESVLGPLVDDPRTFPETSPRLEALRARGAWLYDGVTYVLRGLDRTAVGGPRLTCATGSYFAALNTCGMLRDELAQALAAGLSPAATWDLLPRRRRLLDRFGTDGIWSGAGRSAALSIVCLVAARDGDGGVRYVVQRRSRRVAEDAGLYHLIPSLQFQPADAERSTTDYHIGRSVLRELGEELFVTDDAPAVEAVRRGLADGAAELWVTGLVVDLLSLRPEILTLLFIRDPHWWHTWSPRARVSTEEFGRDPESRTHRRGAAAFQPLDGARELGADGPFAVGRSVVAGAAALIAGLPVLDARMGGQTPLTPHAKEGPCPLS